MLNLLKLSRQKFHIWSNLATPIFKIGKICQNFIGKNFRTGKIS